MKIADLIREACRLRQYSLDTERAYVSWFKRFVEHFGVRHPAEMGDVEVTAFLTHLAADCGVSPSTQNQALNALVFLYGQVLKCPLGEL